MAKAELKAVVGGKTEFQQGSGPDNAPVMVYSVRVDVVSSDSNGPLGRMPLGTFTFNVADRSAYDAFSVGQNLTLTLE